MPTIEQLEQALIKAHRAGDQRALKLIRSQIDNGVAAEAYAGEPIDGMGAGTKVLGGLKHAWDKAAYGLEGAVKGLFGGEISDEHKGQLEAGKRFVEHAGNWAKTGEFAGDVVPYLATGAAGAARGLSLPMSMLAQGATGAVVTPGDAKERAMAGGMGAVGEGAGQLLMKSLGRLAGGVKNIDPSAQHMIDEGIYPTLGGLKGGGFKKFEDSMMSAPYIGPGIEAGRRGAIDEANIAAMNRGLPSGTVQDAGFAGQQQLNDFFDKAFGDATSGIKFDITDGGINQAIDRLGMDASLDANLRQKAIDFFDNFRRYRNIDMPKAPGTDVAIPGTVQPNVPAYISGKDYHDLLRKIRTESTTHRRANDPDKQNYGQVMRGMYDEISALARKQNISQPGALDAFDLARRQYASAAPAIRAGRMNAVAGREGVFTPGQYRASDLNNMKAMGQEGMLRTGEGPNQTFANDMVKAIGNNYPDSGTAGRLLNYGAVTSLPLQMIYAPMSLVGNAALWAGSHAINTPTARRYFAGALPGQKALADALRAKAQAAGMTGAALMGQTQNDF